MKEKFGFLLNNKLISFLVIFAFSIIIAGCGQQVSTVHVDGIEISKKNLYLAEGQTAVISAQVYPFNATNQEYIFESSDDEIVTIENGFVTAKKAGDAVINVYSEEGGYKDTCNVLVTTASDNLELNDYNNLNMPAKELEPIYYEVAQKSPRYSANSASNTQNRLNKNAKNINSKITSLNSKNADNTQNKYTFRDQIKSGLKKVNAEISDDIQAGKNVLDEVKDSIKNSIDSIEQQKQNLNEMYHDLFQNTQDNFIASVKNFQTKILDSMQSIQQTMIDNVESAKEKIETDEVTVETGDINGVTFVVLKDKTNQVDEI